MYKILLTRKYPLRGYCLAPPGGGAAEDNVGERENLEVTQFLVTGYGYGCTYVRMYVRTDVQRDVKVEILF